ARCLDTPSPAGGGGRDAGAAAVLERPDGGRSVRVWVDAAFRYLMVYTGDTLEPADRRRAGIAIAPMTSPPNALRTGVDLIELEPGATWRGGWGISPGER